MQPKPLVVVVTMAGTRLEIVAIGGKSTVIWYELCVNLFVRYNCEHWGKVNLHYWMQFDKTGLTMPMITEHQASCLYSAQKQVCTIPGDCKYRSLPNIGPNVDPDGDYFCNEMPFIQKIGGKPKTPP